MDFQDPFVQAEVDAILTNNDIVKDDGKYIAARLALIGKLYKRGYPLEEILRVAMYVSERRFEMNVAYYRELERFNKERLNKG